MNTERIASLETKIEHLTDLLEKQGEIIEAMQTQWQQAQGVMSFIKLLAAIGMAIATIWATLYASIHGGGQ